MRIQGSRDVNLPARDFQGIKGTAGLLVLLAVLAACALAPASASALPAICDQYPDLPVCAESTGGGGDGSGDDVGSASASGNPDSPFGSNTTGGDGSAGGTGAGGELPFTGYPLTTLLLLMLLLLAIGLTIRAGVAIHDRLRGRDPAPAPPGV